MQGMMEEFPSARPSRIVTPAIVTAPPATTKTRSAWLPLILSFWGLGPAMVRSWKITNAPPVSVMVPLRANVMVSPGWASAMACRNEPGPLSLSVVTTRVSAWRLFSPGSAVATVRTAATPIAVRRSIVFVTVFMFFCLSLVGFGRVRVSLGRGCRN
ncbi:MAG: hypothetical protein KIS67_29170 [Verrucomicrobiae bacterium]|nr:hypothetical protein [Verrucomicrobiae bacterium]